MNFFEDMKSVVDDARGIVEDLGLRPYRIFSVVESWTGGRPGRGEVVKDEFEFLPTPLLDFRSIRRELRSAGAVERGDVSLRKISPSMTEAEVRRLCGCDSATNLIAYIEARDGSGIVRRFVLAGPPYLDSGRFEWVVPLKAQEAQKTGLPRVQ